MKRGLGLGLGLAYNISAPEQLHKAFISGPYTFFFKRHISLHWETKRETHNYFLSANINESRFQTSFQLKTFMAIWPADQLNLTRCLGPGVGQARVKSHVSEDEVL